MIVYSPARLGFIITSMLNLEIKMYKKNTMLNLFKLKALLVLIFVCVLSLYGCRSNDDPEQKLDNNIEINEKDSDDDITETETPVKGGNLNIAIRTPLSLNPLLNSDLTIDSLLRLVFEPLVGLDENLKPCPALAQSWELENEGASIVLRLKEGVIWQNGEQFSADDVIFSLNTIINVAPENTIYKKSAENIAGYEKIDNFTLRINYLKPYIGSIQNLTFPVIPKGYYDKSNMINNETNMKPIGNGLYKFKQYDVMDKVILSTSQSQIKGIPNIDTVTAIVIPSGDDRSFIYAFEQSIIDLVCTNLSDWREYSTSRESNIYSGNTLRYDFIGFNHSKSLYGNINFKKAIAYLLPKEDIIKSVYLGNAIEATTPIHPDSWLFEPETNIYEYNPQKASEYISELKDNLNSASFTILVNIDSSESIKLAEILKKELADIGVNCQIIMTAYENYIMKLENNNYDIFIGGWNLSLIPDFTFAFHSKTAIENGNYINYKNPNMDSLIDLANISVNEASAKSAYSNLQKLIAEELPYVSIAFRHSTILTGKNIIGDVKPVINSPYENVGSLYIRAY